MSRQLSLSGRPWSLDGLIGQTKVVERLRGHAKSGRVVTQWLLVGPSGCGKTTLARIMALSFQCEHQTVFGVPCKACRKDRASFDIYELNASRVTGKDNLEQFLDGSEYTPRVGRYRIYILDECHFLSVNAQNSALKYLEDSPETTMFILCSTAPQRLIDTLQARCGGGLLRLRPLGVEDVAVVVEKMLAKAGSSLPADRLADALVERGVFYPRLIVHAVEKYCAGAMPEEAADVEAATEVDTRALTKSLVRGDWPGVAAFLAAAQNADIQAIRLGCLAFLRKVLWNSPDISDRTEAVAISITKLVELQNAGELVASAGLTAALYGACKIFEQYKH